jgi:hypothetical protein
MLISTNFLCSLYHGLPLLDLTDIHQAHVYMIGHCDHISELILWREKYLSFGLFACMEFCNGKHSLACADVNCDQAIKPPAASRDHDVIDKLMFSVSSKDRQRLHE